MVRRAGSADLPLHAGRLPKRASVPAGASLLAPAHAEDLVPQNGEDNAERSARPPIAEPDDDGAGDELEEAQCGDVAGVAILPHVEHGDRQHDAMARRSSPPASTSRTKVPRRRAWLAAPATGELGMVRSREAPATRGFLEFRMQLTQRRADGAHAGRQVMGHVSNQQNGDGAVDRRSGRVLSETQ